MQKTIIQFDDIDKYGSQSYSGSFAVEAHELGRDEIENIGEVTVDVQASQGDLPGEYVMEGIVAYIADLRCSRCVEPFPFANRSPFHLRYRPRSESSAAEIQDVEISQEELDMEFYDERSIPLRQMAIEQIQLSVPMKPLCEDGCLGLCPRCGANLAREKCACESSITDDRWNALRGIREELARKRDDS
jgi:uncharacterized protein